MESLFSPFFCRFAGKLMWTSSKHKRQLATAHSQLESALLQRTAELQTLSQRLLKVQDEEKRKMSRDLHDSTGQTLAALKISISFLEENFKHDVSASALVAEVAELANQAITEIRTMSYLLHPPLLDEVGFACAAEWYVEGFAKRSGITATLDISNDRERLPISVEIALFRVLQESLTNVTRHSGASDVSVCFRRYFDQIVLEIRDNGTGIPPELLSRLREGHAQTGVGLAGMRERIHELKGKLEIDSNGQSTTLRAIVPHHATDPLEQLKEVDEATAAPLLTVDTPVMPELASVPAALFLQPAAQVLAYKRPRNWALAVVAVVLVLTAWIVRSPLSLRSVGMQRPVAVATPVRLALKNAAVAASGPQHKSDSAVAPQAGRNSTSIHPAPEQEKEVVHIGKDVTVIYFPSKPAPNPVPVAQPHVVHIGGDVTMRLFASSRRDSRKIDTSHPSPKRVSEQSVASGTDVPSEPVAAGAKSRN
jgi:two-component sensor histidine kinase